ncbi:MAG: rhomboid family intramembrane serine protease [Bacillaceae bacterium]|nr:rhomboid family intramembrane serine protease [Bacillaceae bacterium]
MFIRNESFKQFLRFYPVVSTLVAIHLVLWLFTELIPLRFFIELKVMGVGQNALIQEGEYWRIVTAIFFHFGLMHTLFNSFSLVLFGPALEVMLGKLKFILAYVLSGIGGNLATWFLGADYLTHAGASGAIFGLFGIYLYMMIYKKHLLDYQSTQIIKVILILGLIMTFLRANINIFAHIFGLLSGVGLAPLVLQNTRPFYSMAVPYDHHHEDGIQFDPNRWRKKRIPWKKIIFWGVLIILVLLGIFSR